MKLINQKNNHWEDALETLNGISADSNEISQKKRLIWLLDPTAKRPRLYPIEQESVGASWSDGSEIPLHQLYFESNEMDFLTEQDKKICYAIREEFKDSDSNKLIFSWNIKEALIALISHPNLYHIKSPTQKLELNLIKPALIVTKKNDNFHLRLSVDADSTADCYLKQETATSYNLVVVESEHIRLQKVLTTSGLTIPGEAMNHVVSTLKKIANILTVYSPIEIDDVDSIPANSKIHVQLVPSGDGLKVDLFVRPFGEYGPYLKPGSGSKVVIIRNDDKTVQTVRDFIYEKECVKEIISACPILKNQPNATDKWMFDSPRDCLALLAEFKRFEGDIQIEWPQGKGFQTRNRISSDNLKLRINRKRDWFSVDGEVIIDSNQVVSMRTILDKLDETRDEFIQLDDNKFIALTERFKKQLLQLKHITESVEDGQRVNYHGIYALNSIISEFRNVDTDNNWKEQVVSIESVKSINVRLPKTFKATLRNYQVEGFQWMCRLAHLGFGACLADDMGLGKTIQTIALLIKLANEGPSLIVAPSSVCINWLMEIKKFAPTLKVHIFADEDREAIAKNMKKNDVLISSYGLIQNSNHILREIEWRVIVLDEAQAIKNSATKRYKAAKTLNGKFRLALTGTPIENHLGELWSLFNFLNPGLLGSEKSFIKKFVVAIEQYKDKDAIESLKRLIQPFILRRLKNAVLDELPPRTEKIFRIKLTDSERVFYETMRSKALEQLGSTDEGHNERRNIRILAEITKLRQACCHPKLIYPDIDIQSSKLKNLERIVTDILANDHKALIFSQFVTYLSIVRAMLDRKNVEYKYLDGQTPTKKRQKMIDAFQRGEGDVFLLSLKAGGEGINLTAADYVILLDPWWNPAVESQAADRVYRIGQTKPVTVYRLIVQDTVEEKIVLLHDHKKDLANNILMGTGITGKLTENELLELIKQ